MHDPLTTGARQRLLALIRDPALGGIVTSLTEPHAIRGTDTSLLACCARFAAVEEAKMALYTGPARIADDDQREDRLAPLIADQQVSLQRICARAAISPGELQTKAAIWLIWDGGELFQRAIRHGLLEDLLLVSIFQDLEAAA